MASVDQIIKRIGGLDATARLTGVGLEAVRKWRQSRAVPSKHWQAIMAATGLAVADLLAESPVMEQTDVPPGATAVLMLADGTALWGVGFGAHHAGQPAELCFNTGMTGYQETLTDPSYAGQIITFTFPHIGNTGTTAQDLEASTIAARGVVVKQTITDPSNWRSTAPLDQWLRTQNVPGIGGLDTRAITHRIRDGLPPTGVLSFPANGRFDLPALHALAAGWPGLDGMDLAREVSCTQSYVWSEGLWAWPGTYDAPPPRHHVVAVDYGAKRNILRSLVAAGCRVTVMPAQSTADDILRHAPDGVFLSNGPGDPAATGTYAVPAIQGVLAARIPVFGICLGHQLLALALGARTYKLDRGHHGANQPVKELSTGRVEITSQNHGFAVDDNSLPPGVRITHTSLFDGSNEGIASDAHRAFSVQYHPEASPGPADSQHLFHRFTALMQGPN